MNSPRSNTGVLAGIGGTTGRTWDSGVMFQATVGSAAAAGPVSTRAALARLRRIAAQGVEVERHEIPAGTDAAWSRTCVLRILRD
jgi:hypothetical protein